MKQAIVIFPEENKIIEDIRERYDSSHEKIMTHISLVYFIENVHEGELINHIQNSLANMKKFEITLKGLQASTNEYYLYLNVEEGKDKLIRLHEKLNSGILDKFRNKDMPEYIPHITLGIFDDNKSLIEGMKKIEEMNLSVKQVIDSVYLVTLDGNKLIGKRKFELEDKA